MMRILRVGDPHVKVSNLEESERLLEFVLATAKTRSVDRIEILGDLHHTHAIVRLEVLAFWHKWLRHLAESFQTIVLVGNHDMSGNTNSTLHALMVVESTERLLIVDKPTLKGVFGYMPYIHDAEQFIAEANKLVDQGAKLIVCHGTFKGSKYDNGFYAPDGIDATRISVPLISGHVHTRQRFGNVIYPGTSRWDTASDANQEKGLWLVEHGQNGEILQEEFIDTSSVCSPIYSVEWKEGEAAPEALSKPNARIAVELIGSSDWISQVKGSLKGKVSVRTRFTDKKQERRQTSQSLHGFIQEVFDSSADKAELISLLQDLDNPEELQVG